MKKVLFFIICCFFLISCVPIKKNNQLVTVSPIYYTITQKEIDDAKYRTLPKDYKQVIKKFFYFSLGSPNLSKYVFYHPTKAYNPLTNMVFWVVSVDVSIKNQQGKYDEYVNYTFSSNSQGEMIDITALLNSSTIRLIDSLEKED